MCGIAGFCDFNRKLDREALVSMTDRLIHRGPDDAGYSLHQTDHASVGFGHRRLSILDLSAHGHQPMQFEQLEIAYNGEVYNFKRIRRELEDLGYGFHSDSDTEVILKAWHQWGIKAVDKFVGMFAIALYDRKANKVYFIRDRAGVKPLYYHWHNGRLLFASELKSFHALADFPREVDQDSVAQYLQLGYVPEPYSIFKNTFKLPAGCYLELDLSRQTLQERRYWDAFDAYRAPKLALSDSDAIEQMEALLKEAFELRMVADVPVGVFLSGGYDSSLVTALLQTQRTERLKTFTIGFHEQGFDEAPHARAVAEHLGTDHHEHYCSEREAIDIIPKLAHFYDEPFSDVSAVPTILVSRIAREQVTVSLSADGGDELFGGYTKYLSRVEKQAKVARLLKLLGASNIDKLAGVFQRSGLTRDVFFGGKFAKLLFEGSADLQKIVPYFATPNDKQSLLPGYRYNRRPSNFDRVGELAAGSELDRMLGTDYITYMVDDVLQKVDRATMSVSLEGREPLLDHRILEMAARLPDTMKIRHGDKKWLLKQITHKHIPPSIMERPKMGFGVPIERWMKAELRGLLDEQLIGGRSEILNNAALAGVHRRYLAGRENHQLVWGLLALRMWEQEWLA